MYRHRFSDKNKKSVPKSLELWDGFDNPRYHSNCDLLLLLASLQDLTIPQHWRSCHGRNYCCFISPARKWWVLHSSRYRLTPNADSLKGHKRNRLRHSLCFNRLFVPVAVHYKIVFLIFQEIICNITITFCNVTPLQRNLPFAGRISW